MYQIWTNMNILSISVPISRAFQINEHEFRTQRSTCKSFELFSGEINYCLRKDLQCWTNCIAKNEKKKKKTKKKQNWKTGQEHIWYQNFVISFTITSDHCC